MNNTEMTRMKSIISQFCVRYFSSSMRHIRGLHNHIQTALISLFPHSWVARPHTAVLAPSCIPVSEHFCTFLLEPTGTFRQSQCCIVPWARFCKPHCRQQCRSWLGLLGTHFLEPFLGQPGKSEIQSCGISGQPLLYTAPLDTLCTPFEEHCCTVPWEHFGTGFAVPVYTLAVEPS